MAIIYLFFCFVYLKIINFSKNLDPPKKKLNKLILCLIIKLSIWDRKKFNNLQLQFDYLFVLFI